MLPAQLWRQREIPIVRQVAINGSSPGETWLNVTGFAVDKLPYIQHDMGIHTLDNLKSLNVIAGLAKTAATRGQWGDIVFLYNAFTMNAYVDFVKVSSDEMHRGLLSSVMKEEGGQPNHELIELYANTSSSPYLTEAFNKLKSETGVDEKRWFKEVCDSAHKASKAACRSLLSGLSGSASWKSGGPRSICKKGCCVSWSANATFQLENLTSAANYCMSACASASISCKVDGVSLQGTIVNECLSNRATHCS